ncbi:MAG TPA: stage II sporulation protein P [Candidatus Faecisoma merdavium]|nr:stage II sporulation protein P [Candidatus Faecisoma merdavium]
MKKMKLKKPKRVNFIVFLIIICILFLVVNFLLKKIELNSNELFVKKLLQKSNYYLINENLDTNLTYKLFKFDLKNPITIMDKVFAYEKDIQTFAYIQNNFVDNPRVYIYSTHPNEKYIDNTISYASLILQEKLNSLQVETIVEERSVVEYLEDNNLEFDDSYKATREFLSDKLKIYDFDLIIDLHRDAVNNTTIKINNEEYAKIMFVQNVNYKDNITLANKLNDILNEKYPGITRGIYNKYVDNFNQDLNNNVLLIELGGNTNTFEQVNNSIDALAYSIKELLNEN